MMKLNYNDIEDIHCIKNGRLKLILDFSKVSKNASHVVLISIFGKLYDPILRKLEQIKRNIYI